MLDKKTTKGGRVGRHTENIIYISSPTLPQDIIQNNPKKLLTQCKESYTIEI